MAERVEEDSEVASEVAYKLAEALGVQAARHAAARCLAYVPPPSAAAARTEVMSLMRALAAADEDAEVREAACRVLGIYARGEGSGKDKEELLGVLINRFDDCDERVQLAALQACSCLAGGSNRRVLAAASDLLFPASSTVSRLRVADADVGSAGQAVLVAAVRLACRVAGGDVKQLVRCALQGLRHESWHVRRAAGLVLRELKGSQSKSRVFDAVVDELVRGIRHCDASDRAAAVQGVAALFGAEGGGSGRGGEEVTRLEAARRHEFGGKLAGQVAHVAGFRCRQRRDGVRSDLVSALLCLGAPAAARALEDVITSQMSDRFAPTSPSAAAPAAEADASASAASGGLHGVGASRAAVLSEGVAALAELSRRSAPGALNAAVRAAAAVLQASPPPRLSEGGGGGGLWGGGGGGAAGARLSVEDTLALQHVRRLALTLSVGVMTGSAGGCAGGSRSPSLPRHALSDAAASKAFNNDGNQNAGHQTDGLHTASRRALDVYTLGPWRRLKNNSSASAGVGNGGGGGGGVGRGHALGGLGGSDSASSLQDGLHTASLASVPRGSTRRQDEARIQVLLTRELPAELYCDPSARTQPLSQPFNEPASVATDALKTRATRRAGFVAKVARDGEGHAAADPLEAGVADGWGGGVVFSRECALVEAACVPEGRVREWEHSRQRLAKALGALQLLQRRAKNSASVAEVERMPSMQSFSRAPSFGRTASVREAVLRAQEGQKLKAQQAQHRVLAAAQASKDVENRQEVKALSALLQRWQERKKREEEAEEAARKGQTETEKQDAVEQTVDELGLAREGKRDKARQKKPEQIAKIDRRIATITTRLAHAEARYQAVAEPTSMQAQIDAAQREVEAARAAADAARNEEEYLDARVRNVANRVQGRPARALSSGQQRGAGGGADASGDAEDAKADALLYVGGGGEATDALLRGWFLCRNGASKASNLASSQAGNVHRPPRPTHTPEKGAGDITERALLAAMPDASGPEDEEEGEDRVEMVACEFGCSREMKEQAGKDEGGGAGRQSRTDAEARGRSRYLVDDEGCLTFSGASGKTDIDSACMQAIEANPVLLDTQLVNPKLFAGKLVVCRLGKCAAAAKALRAAQARVKCLVISVDTFSGRPLAPPASGLDRSVRDIDIPVFCVSRKDEARLLSAASVRISLFPAAKDDVGEVTQDVSDEDKEEGGAEGEERAGHRKEMKGDRKEENVLEGVRLQSKESKELNSKWSRWMAHARKT